MKKNLLSTVLLVFSIALLAAGCSSQTALQTQPIEGQTQTLTSPSVTPAVSPTPSTQTPVKPSTGTQTNQNPNGSDYFPNGHPGDITVKETVEGSSLNKPSATALFSENALDLLKATHTVLTKNYSGIGDFVTSIDGHAADSKHFWEFFVNGKSSNIGASSYTLKEGDIIEWKFSVIN